MGSFDPEGNYIPRQITEDDLGGPPLEDVMAGTIVEFDDGDIVEGTVVKIDRDEVLLDIGFKSEGVIPARELSIRNDVHPEEIVSLGDHVEALVLQKEDKEGRLVLSKKRAQYERAWSTIEKLKDADEVVKGPVIEVVKGGLIVDIGLRGFLPGLLGRAPPGARAPALRGPGDRGQDHRARPQPQQRGPLPPGLAGRGPEGAARRLPGQPASRASGAGASSPRSSTSGPSSTSAAWTAWSTCPSSAGSTSTTRPRWSRWATRSRSRCSTSISTRSASACRSRPPRPTRGRSSPTATRSGQLVYGRITKLVPFGAFVQVGDGIEGLVHISEMAAHHVDLPEQVVSPGEELWVKIIDIDLQRRRISLSIKQAAEGGEVSEEYREAFGEHAYDDEGNYIGTYDYSDTEFTPETEAQAAWADYATEPAEPAESAEPAEAGAPAAASTEGVTPQAAPDPAPAAGGPSSPEAESPSEPAP